MLGVVVVCLSDEHADAFRAERFMDIIYCPGLLGCGLGFRTALVYFLFFTVGLGIFVRWGCFDLLGWVLFPLASLLRRPKSSCFSYLQAFMLSFTG
jgi:hypothetical protein